MSEVCIETIRGTTLSASFINPVDTRDAAVILAHAFLGDRHGRGFLDRFAGAYRAAGYATLQLDLSGHGHSDPEVITTKGQTEDLRSASLWLSQKGFTRQALHANQMSTVAAVMARPKAVQTYIFGNAIVQPTSFEWSFIFSEEQLDQLESHGIATIPNDSAAGVAQFLVSKQTLADLSLVDGEDIYKDLRGPVLFLQDHSADLTGGTDGLTQVFHLVDDGSRVEIVRELDYFSQDPDLSSGIKMASELCCNWVQKWLPLPPR